MDIPDSEKKSKYIAIFDDEGYVVEKLSFYTQPELVPKYKQVAPDTIDIVSIVIQKLAQEYDAQPFAQPLTQEYDAQPFAQPYDAQEFTVTVNNWLGYRMETEDERQVVGDLASILIAKDKGSLLAKFLELRTEANSSELDAPYICQFLTCSFLPEELSFIAQVLDPELFKLLHGYVFQKDRTLLASAFYNMDHLFPPESTDYDIAGLNQVVTKAERFKNEYLQEYVSKLIKLQKRKDETDLPAGEDIEYADKPEWILPFEGNPYCTHKELLELLPELSNQSMMRSWDLVDVTIPPGPWVSKGPEEDATFISKLHTTDYDQEAMRLGYLDVFSRMDVKAREDLISDVIKNSKLLHLSKNEEVFRILGPSNPDTGYIGLELESDDPCLLYGGHRLIYFTC
jgi:hypothetical protein